MSDSSCPLAGTDVLGKGDCIDDDSPASRDDAVGLGSGTKNCSDPKKELVAEGKAKVFLPPGVFYNPVQEFNRDMTVAVINRYASLVEKEAAKKRGNGEVIAECAKSLDSSGTEKGISILEALAASGLRSVRFALEIPGVKRIVANDYDAAAVELMKRNISENGVGDLVTAVCSDAALLMHQHQQCGGYDVIDLDPYGSPSRFLDPAVQALKDGGLLCVTCTDTAILCGNASEKCWASYGSMSLKTRACHEMALRIVLRSIESHATRYGRYIAPLMSISVDFYLRMFMRIFSSPAKAKESASKSSMVYQCTGCSSLAFQPLGRMTPTTSCNGQAGVKYSFATGPPVGEKCQHCGSTHHLGGPIYSGRIHDRDFVNDVLADVESRRADFGTSGRMIGMLSVISEELPDVPLYYLDDTLCMAVHCVQPGFIQLRSAILHAGYNVSMSHANEKSIKTNAPAEILWDIIRCWVKRRPVNAKRLSEDRVAMALLSKEPKIEACFEPHPDANPVSRRNGLRRFQTGMKDWGPKSRAKKNPLVPSEGAESLKERSKRRQSKNKNKRSLSETEAVNKSYTCKRLKATGSCEYGSECKYSHTLDESAIVAGPGISEQQNCNEADQGTKPPMDQDA